MLQGSSLLLQVALRARHIRNISIKKAVGLHNIRAECGRAHTARGLCKKELSLLSSFVKKEREGGIQSLGKKLSSSTHR